MNTDYARRQMIEQQVRAWDVYDHDVLRVFREIPRERFVPEGWEALAFADTEIPLAYGEAMMTPTVEGRLLQALELDGTENVLEIGTGSGFLTTCLASLARQVTSIDIYPDFLESARSRFSDLDARNVDLLEMDGTQSLPEGSFDAIAVTGSLQQFDPRLVEALTIGGRLFIVVGDAPAMQAKLLVKTEDNDWQSETLFETMLAPLRNGAPPPQFSF